jgi:hypothetical protein
MSTQPVTVRQARKGVLRTGLVLAGLLGALDIAGGISQLSGDSLLPVGVAVATIVLGAATLALIPFAWRGARWAGWTIAAVRVASALTGLPAFFVAGVPTAAVIAASTGIVLAVIVTALIAFGMESRR